MRLVAYLHLFPPEHNAGSETTVHAALRAMVRRGHTVQVICDRSKQAPYEIDSIQVVRPPRRGLDTWLHAFVKGANLLVTHLDLTSQAMNLAISAKIPLVHFVHNDAQLMYWRVDGRVPYKNALTVYNAHWLANKPSCWAGQMMPDEWKPQHSVIVHPIVEPERYRCERGASVTLVNPTWTKGAGVLLELARRLPEQKFLAVEGGYGDQVIVSADSQPKHEQVSASGYIEWMAHTPDIREVFRRTKILLMPSDYESYGRVGIEAACAGIPTIAHPTEGLKEAFGEAAIFCDRDNVNDWQREVDRLLTDDVYYRKRSDMALALADSLTPEAEFDRLEEALMLTAERNHQEVAIMKTWKSDRWIWKLQDGNYKATSDRRIPPDAVTLFAGLGTEIPEETARRHGWTSVDEKAIHGPVEDKSTHAPKETKSKKTQAA